MAVFSVHPLRSSSPFVARVKFHQDTSALTFESLTVGMSMGDQDSIDLAEPILGELR